MGFLVHTVCLQENGEFTYLSSSSPFRSSPPTKSIIRSSATWDVTAALLSISRAFLSAAAIRSLYCGWLLSMAVVYMFSS